MSSIMQDKEKLDIMFRGKHCMVLRDKHGAVNIMRLSETVLPSDIIKELSASVCELLDLLQSKEDDGK